MLIRLLQHSSDVAKVGLERVKPLSKRPQSLSGVFERRRVEIHSDHASISRRFQNRFAVYAQPNRTIDKETSSLRSKELQCLFKQHGAMGRASAPQRRSRHHRPVISFKELLSFMLRSLCFVLCFPFHKVQSTNYQALNTKSRNRSFVFFRVWIGEHPGFELIEFPNFQIGQVAHHCDISDYFRTLAQQRMNQQAALAVQRSLLTKVVRSIKELSSRRIHRGQQRESLLDRLPFRQRVNPDTITLQARDIKVFAVLLVDQPPKFSWNFEATFDINSCRVISSQHILEPDERALVGGLKEKCCSMIGVATRLDPLPTTFDHPRPDTTPRS